MEAQENYFIVAADDIEKIVGTGLLQSPGKIKLCYVLPEALGTGVGKLLMSEMEKQAVFLGSKECVLSSTITAEKFYKKQGYVSEGKGLALGKIPFVSMRKKLNDI